MNDKVIEVKERFYTYETEPTDLQTMIDAYDNLRVKNASLRERLEIVLSEPNLPKYQNQKIDQALQDTI